MTSSASAEITYKQLVADDWEGLKRIGSVGLPIVYPDEYWIMLSSDYETHYSLGAFLNDELVGTVAIVKDCKETYAPRSGPEQSLVNQYDQVAYVSCLVVAEKVRRQGVGTSLLNRSMDKLQMNGVEAFYLHVMVSNEKAIRLYTKLAFCNESTIANYYTIDGVKSDAFFYVRRLLQPLYSQRCSCNGACAII